MRIYLAKIRSYCFLHSLKSFAKVNSVKTAKKTKNKKLQVTLKQRTRRGKPRPRYIVSGAINRR